MKFQLPTAVTRTVSRTILKTRANSPTILFVGGVAGVVTSTVLACKATLKVDEVLDEHRKTAMNIKTVEHEHYGEIDRKHDLTLLYVQSAVKFTKLYGPAVILGSVSIGMLTKSHNILSKRNAALTAAYTALEKGFKDYRKRVVDEFGEDKDREFRFGKKTETILQEDTNGKKKVNKTRFGDGGGSIYSKIFDEYNQNWDPHPEYNVLFLRGVQSQCNDRLQARGHLFLNDVYRDLGMEDTTEGAVVGWLADGDGDGFVDFGIFEDKSMTRMHDFLIGREGGIMLDFNVDGTIFDKIGKRSKR
jgi:hypothetical protein